MVSILLTILSVTFFQAASAITLEYLGGVDQINSPYVDYFFYCKVNDDNLEWRANILNATASSMKHLGSLQSGKNIIEVKTNNDEVDVRFVYLLLSNQDIDPEINSLLVVSQLRENPNFNFSIFCRNTSEASESRSDTNISNPLNFVRAHGIILTHLLSRNITDNLFIHTFVCTIPEREISLRVNNTVVLNLTRNGQNTFSPMLMTFGDKLIVIDQATDFTIRNVTKQARRDPDSAILVVNHASSFNVSCSNGINDVYLQVNSIMATDATPTTSPTSNNTSQLTTTMTSSSLITTNLMSATPSNDSNPTDAYRESMSSSKTSIIVGCIVGIGIGLSLLIVAIVLFLCFCVRTHSRSNSKDITNSIRSPTQREPNTNLRMRSEKDEIDGSVTGNEYAINELFQETEVKNEDEGSKGDKPAEKDSMNSDSVIEDDEHEKQKRPQSGGLHRDTHAGEGTSETPANSEQQQTYDPQSGGLGGDTHAGGGTAETPANSEQQKTNDPQNGGLDRDTHAGGETSKTPANSGQQQTNDPINEPTSSEDAPLLQDQKEHARD